MLDPFWTADAAIWLAIGYALGSIPFGLLVAKAFGLGDIRKIGSGNIGTTNVLRTGNKLAALLTLIGDGGKGALAVFLATMFGPEPSLMVDEPSAAVAGLGALLGHMYPVWLKFKGCKGMATFLGVQLVGAFWPAAVLTCAAWLFAVAITRKSSIGALFATAVTPSLALMTTGSKWALVTCLMSLLIWWAHRSNLVRIFKGTEPRIGEKKPDG